RWPLRLLATNICHHIISDMKSFSLAIAIVFPFLAAAQADSLQFFNSFDGTKIAYQVKGTGEPVLLVHGFISNGESWKRTALYNDLLTAGYKVIILDQRGNGRSDKPHTPEAYAKN